MSGQDQQYSTGGGGGGGDAAVTITSQLMIAAVIFLFMVVVFVFFLYLYAKHYMTHPVLRRGSTRFRFSPAELIPVHRGLDIELLNSLPIKAFKAADFKEGLECSVCLSEVTEDEEVRLLPNCKHSFHVKCIDMWFYSHTTCPLCRSTVDFPPPEAGIDNRSSTESAVFPTNVLFWGTQDRIVNRSQEESSSSSRKSGKRPEGMLVIDIPRRTMEGFPPSPMSPLPTSRYPVEDMKSPAEEVKTPMSGKLRSFRMLLNRGKRAIDSCSPRGGDIEQGIAGSVVGEGSSLAPKTPTTPKC